MDSVNINNKLLNNVLSIETCQLISEYALFQSNLKAHKVKGDPLSGVHRQYGDPLMELLLEKLTPLIEKQLGKELWPTLSFYYVYKNGDQLLRHKDRSSCEYVLGVCLGADDEFKRQHGTWPLILNQSNQEVPIHLHCGDAVIFKGYETEHWRTPFLGQWYVSAIFAFVDKNGPLHFQKYDQRKSLGQPHIGMFRWYFGCLKQKLKKETKLY